MVDFGDLADKAQDALKNVSDSNIDKAADFVESKVDDKFDGIVEKAADAAKKFNDK